MSQVVFNHEKSTMATTSHRGFTLFNCPPFGPFKATRSETNLGGVALVALLYATPLVAVVPLARNRTSLQLYELEKHEVISEVQFDQPIVNVLINSKRVVVVLEGHIHVFDLNTMECLTQLKTQNPPNPKGIAAMSDVNLEFGGSWFGWPQCVKSSDAQMGKGDIMLLNCKDVKEMAVIPAHKTAVSQMTFSNDGSMLATCSDKGTVVRVWNPGTCTMLFACRRGTGPATLWSLAFSPGGNRLAVTGDTGTLHVFETPTGGAQGSEIRASRKQKGLKETKTIVSMDERLTTLMVITLPTSNGGTSSTEVSSQNFGAVGTSTAGGAAGAGTANADSGFVVSIFNMEQRDSKQDGFTLVKEVALGLM